MTSHVWLLPHFKGAGRFSSCLQLAVAVSSVSEWFLEQRNLRPFHTRFLCFDTENCSKEFNITCSWNSFCYQRREIWGVTVFRCDSRDFWWSKISCSFKNHSSKRLKLFEIKSRVNRIPLVEFRWHFRWK